METRTLPVHELRLLDSDQNDRPQIRGIAVVYNELSQDLGGFREQFAPGSLRKTLQESNVKAVWNHDDKYVLGSVKAGTLRLNDTTEGLEMIADPPETEWANGLLESIRRGDVDQMSFRFQVVRDDWDQRSNGEVVRTVLEAKLIEVSPVSFPAYPQTALSLRGLLGSDLQDQEIEKALVKARAGRLEETDKEKIRAIVDSLSKHISTPGQVSTSEEQSEAVAEKPQEERVDGTSFRDLEDEIEATLYD
jgi:HK97 family phage prohead protease